MCNPLCVLFIATVCWQYVSSRYVVQQPLYSPYSDYGYSYTDSASFKTPFPHQAIHSPFYSPPGTYFDQRQGILRPFPGGGVPVLVDYHKRCSNQYVGLMAHPSQQQYYYMCKPDCVIFGKCQNLQMFNATSGQCIQHPPPEYIPTCTEVGRFPLFSDCHLYYKCEEDFQAKIYSCPTSMVFSPITKMCIEGNKCTPTQISPHSSYIPEYCANKFPPCLENGIFRSPTDCSLYYKCDLKNNGVYIQTRLRCPQDNFFDLQKNECLPANEVSCDCIQVAELVYPKSDAIPFQPAMYPSQYDVTLLEESQYPVEQTKEELHDSCNINENKNMEGEFTTTLVPIVSKTTLNEEKAVNAFILPNFIDIKHLNDNLESEALDDLEQNSLETTMSSEEESSVESFDLEADSGETTTLKWLSEHATRTSIQETLTTIKEGGQSITATDSSGEPTLKPENLLVEEQSTSQVVMSTEKNIGATNNQEEDVTANEISPNFCTSKICGNDIKSSESSDKPLTADTQLKNSTQTLNNKFLSMLEIKSPNTDSELTKGATVARDSRSTLNEQSTPTVGPVTFTPTTTQMSTTKPTIPSQLLEINQFRSDATLASEKDNLEDNPLNLAISPRLLKFPITNTDVGTNLIHTNLKSTSNDLTQSTLIYATTLDSLSPINDVTSLPSFNKTINKLKLAMPTKEMEEELVKDLKIHNATTKTIHDQTTWIPILNKELKGESTTIKIFPVATTAPPPPDNPSDLLLGKQFASLQSENKIEWNESLVYSPNQPNRKQKSIMLREVDFREEELLPAHGKSTFIDELVDQTTDFNFMGEKVFDDDYTTILADKKTTTPATRITKVPIGQPKFKRDETFLQSLDEQTKIDNKQSSNIFTKEQSSTDKKATATETNSPNERSILLRNQIGELSNKVIASAEETQATFDSEQQFLHNPFTTLTPTQLPATTLKRTTDSTPKTSKIQKPTTESNVKHSKPLVLHVRATDYEQPSLDSRLSKSLYYILKTKPVINKNVFKFDHASVSVAPFTETNNRNVPRLEIIAERPIDVHFSICSSACTQNHQHNYTQDGSRPAVLLKWFSNKSEQTLGFQTANQKFSDDN